MGSGPMSPHPLPQQMPQLGGMPAFSQANMQFGLQQPSYPAFFGQQPNPQQRHQPHDPRMLPSSQQMLGVSYGAQAGLPGYAGMPEGANQPGFNQYSPMGLQMAGMGGGETSISAQGGSVAGSDTPGWRGSVPPGTPGGGGGGGGGGPSGAPMTPSLSFGVGIGAGGAGPASSSGMSGGKGKGRGAAENEVRMPDPNDKGWMPEPINADEAERTYLAILHKVYEYRDKEGKRLAEPLERCPDPDKDPSYYELVSMICFPPKSEQVVPPRP